MATNDPIWSYGRSTLFTSSGATVADGDDEWSYGVDKVQHEYVVAAVGRPLPQRIFSGPFSGPFEGPFQ